MSTVYRFNKLYEAIFKPETGHRELALGENGYIDRILKVAERFQGPLARQGRGADYHRVIDKFKTLEEYFEAYPQSRLKKTEANKLREAVYKSLCEWNHGQVPD